jgi:hypothetical protein
MADRRQITDPKALRALAHPLRWKLLEIVSREGTATATQCAQGTGESVASCSYHLNMLAKYDYVEQAEGGQGREKPWRLVHPSQGMSDVGMDDEGVLAMQAASGAFLDYALTQIRDRQLSTHLEPDEWRAVIGIDNSNDYLTPAEVNELREAFNERLDHYRERRLKPELRPEGSRPVNFFLSATVAPTD